jgi:hypothetical protein
MVIVNLVGVSGSLGSFGNVRETVEEVASEKMRRKDWPPRHRGRVKEEAHMQSRHVGQLACHRRGLRAEMGCGVLRPHEEKARRQAREQAEGRRQVSKTKTGRGCGPLPVFAVGWVREKSL